MIAYPLLRTIHVTSVALSFAGFALRGIWMMRSPERLAAPVVRIVPHVVDTVLLASALGLAFTLGQYPGRDGWLTAKVLGLLAYIVLGTIALKRGRSRGVRIAAWWGALLVFGWIVAVAATRDPMPWRHWWP